MGKQVRVLHINVPLLHNALSFKKQTVPFGKGYFTFNETKPLHINARFKTQCRMVRSTSLLTMTRFLPLLPAFLKLLYAFFKILMKDAVDKEYFAGEHLLVRGFKSRKSPCCLLLFH